MSEVITEENSKQENDVQNTGSRLNIWQKKLLNLSPSNPLLNCKINQTNLIILCPEPAKIEDFLADGAKMSLVSAEEVLEEKIDAEKRAFNIEETLFKDMTMKTLKEKQILVNVPKEKLKTQLVALYRKTKTILEEGGSNTLYLAVGFLNWKRKDKPDKICRAPLVLCPVKLERPSMQSGVKLSAHEDESRFNTTLLQMLKQDFGILIPELEEDLPTDESGLDVPKIWQTVKDAVKGNNDFEVVEEVVLGHFSFNKYLMWKDLVDRKDAMLSHPIVSVLIDKTKKLPDDGEFVKPDELDKLYKPNDFYTPLPVDSSQLAVIAAADKGKSFVIEGPPGTGKSQTISNLIAHMIAKGKTVLFVSEKMAALEVVYRRLEKIGLGRFCLELHSNKANKKDVVNRLRQSWEGVKLNTDIKWEEKSQELLKARDELNNVVNTLHTKASNGLTPYYAMSMYIKNTKLAEIYELNWDSSNAHNEKEYADLKDLVHKISVQVQTCSDLLPLTSLKSVKNTDWTPDWQKDIVFNAKKSQDLYEKVKNEGNSFAQTLGINIKQDNYNTINALYELSLALKDSYLHMAGFVFTDKASGIIETSERALSHLEEYNKAYNGLNCLCADDIWKKVNADLLLKKWNLAKEKGFLGAFFDKLSISGELKKAGAKGRIKLPEDIELISILTENGKALIELGKYLNDVKIYSCEKTNINDLKKLLNLAKKLRYSISVLAQNPDNIGIIKESINNANTFEKPSAAFEQSFNDFKNAYSEFEKLCKCNFKEENSVIDNINEIISNEGRLKDWCLWQKLIKEAESKNIYPVITAIENGKLKNNDIELSFESTYCAWMSKKIITENAFLKEFSSSHHMDKIKQFIKLDEDFRKITVDYINAKLSQRVPTKEHKSLSPEWGLLQHEMQKQRQIKPIRYILANASSAVKKLTPCLMMSPLSVAQYLPVSKESFDVIVFDEASQITVWDAIGSLSRGQQIIVAGDPKQMPPSNFFGRSIEYNEDEIDIDEDLESILDELIASALPTLRLNWHYRSRCESLIKFSNEKYYDNSLVTFPSAKTNQKSVSLRFIENGCYEKGVRINTVEAQAVVKECVQRLTSDNPEIKNKSIGIVTFNSDQQKLIEDLLDEQRELHPEIEFAFNPDNPDALFVKNLETVQGDERDVIIFSVTFGPDKDGKISMNFGPLNRAGGERRLNVAFTRSKYEMIIFSSMEADKIDLTRTNAQGAQDLKAFLQYAKSGYDTAEKTNIINENKINMPFEEEIALQLKNLGWKVDTQIGSSSLRIDIAVVHPDNPDIYLAGIECDGKSYSNCATARDRDISRQSVLEGLGWNIIKVWSIDWWTDKKGSLEKLNNELKKLYEKNRG